MGPDQHPREPGRRGPAPNRLTPRRTRTAVATLLVVVAVTGLVGCGTSGRTLRDPIPGATAPPRKTSSTTSSAVVQAVPQGLSIASSAWTAGGEIPLGYTCDGQNVSPPLSITGAPEGTVELVLLVTDEDAPGFRHWVVAGIPPGATFVEGQIPAGAVEAPNSSRSTAWSGPCPPAGETHHYDFTVYALSVPSGLGFASSTDDVDSALGQAISTAAMTGTYQRA